MFWLKIFKDSYFLNPWVGSFSICTVVRYWFKNLHTFIRTLLIDLDVKTIDLKNLFYFRVDVLVKVF